MKYETDAYARQLSTEVRAVQDGLIVLADTVFYPMGGGQPGDTGQLKTAQGTIIPIVDTRRAPWDRQLIVHMPENAAALEPGMEVLADLNWERRYRHMRMHTCMHLLATLIPAPVTGSAVGDQRGRLDFDLPDPTIEREDLTQRLQALIDRAIPVHCSAISIDELKVMPDLIKGSLAISEEMQGPIRIVEIEGIDRQACGGTHVANTSEIGKVVCSKIEKKSRHNRRVVIEFA